VFQDFMASPDTEVLDLLFPTDQTVLISWKFTDENIGPAACQCTCAFKPYTYFDSVGEDVLYSDKDFVIGLQEVSEQPKVRTGNFLCDLVTELEECSPNAYIEGSVSTSLQQRGPGNIKSKA
jgi:hypothetical protein